MTDTVLSPTRPAAGEASMWRHFCRVEHVLISVGQGQRCNWCMERELADGDEPRPALLARQPATAT